MPFGFVLSLAFHAALLGWALFSMRSVPPLTPDTPAISADIITPSDFLRLKQGSEDAKNLETKAKDEPKPDDSKNDTAKPSNAPPPPPPPSAGRGREGRASAGSRAAGACRAAKGRRAAKTRARSDREKDRGTAAAAAPEPAPGPTPDEKKLLEQKLEQEHQAEEAKKKAEEEAKQKADEEAKKKADEEAKKKAEEEAKKKAEEAAKKKRAAELKKKKQEEAKKKAEAAKKKFDPSKIASLLAKSPDDAPPKALLDKDPRKKGQQASGSSATSRQVRQGSRNGDGHRYGAVGARAGSFEGHAQIAAQRLLAAARHRRRRGGACGRTHWEMSPDGTLIGEPRVTSAPSTTAGQVYTEAAMRAVKMCSPFRLPPDKYDAWKIVDWTFDPRQML